MSEAEARPVETKPKLRWYQYKRRTLLIFAALCCIGLSLWACCRELLKPRSMADADLIKHFYTHETHFEKLRLMLAEDKDLGVMFGDGSCAGPGCFAYEVTLSPARDAEYRDVMCRAGLTGQIVWSAHSRGEHKVEIYLGGVVCNKSLRGYIYSSRELAPLKSSLDLSNEAELKVDERWYKRINGNWYLFVMNAGSSD